MDSEKYFLFNSPYFSFVVSKTMDDAITEYNYSAGDLPDGCEFDEKDREYGVNLIANISGEDGNSIGRQMAEEIIDNLVSYLNNNEDGANAVTVLIDRSLT